MSVQTNPDGSETVVRGHGYTLTIPGRVGGGTPRMIAMAVQASGARVDVGGRVVELPPGPESYQLVKTLLR